MEPLGPAARTRRRGRRHRALLDVDDVVDEAAAVREAVGVTARSPMRFWVPVVGGTARFTRRRSALAGFLLIWVVGSPRPLFGGMPVRRTVVRSMRFSVGEPRS